ncbi:MULTISPECIES: hypothetical protein [Pseudomonas]|uniref:hypothetical protein n=1 Tax=Pseudomonas TaxID=286 RepID=UPI001239E491|nr:MULTISPECIES: hypothetical protein [Pseudomonas]QIB49815.1 hypothetical protein G3M63_01310 [Pseudomonas sp. OIL-1]
MPNGSGCTTSLRLAEPADMLQGAPISLVMTSMSSMLSATLQPRCAARDCTTPETLQASWGDEMAH